MKLLFVCTGNICRSPTGEGVMRGLVAARGLEDRVAIDSAGTGDWHLGEAPDPRTAAAALARGLTLDGVSRQVRPSDFDEYDLILAADRYNQRDLLALAGDDVDRRGRVHMLREFDPTALAEGDLEVPDPYYGGPDGFETVLDICEAACAGLLDHLEASGQL